MAHLLAKRRHANIGSWGHVRFQSMDLACGLWTLNLLGPWLTPYIWENSLLLQDMLDGTVALLDFEFWIGGSLFKILFFLVDGIYPKTAGFVKPVSVPIGRVQKFSAWQEATCKNIELVFGVLQRNSKFYTIHLKNGTKDVSIKWLCVYCAP